MDQKKFEARIPISLPEGKRDSLLILWVVVMLLGCFCLGLLSIWFHIVDAVAVVVMAFILFTVALMAAMWSIPLYCYLKADGDSIGIFFCGREIRRVPVSQIKLICSTGKMGYRNLCLSLLSVEELACCREEILKKGVFTKTELPFRKRKAQWQEEFAGEYLQRPKLRDCKFWKDSPAIWLSFAPAAVIYLKAQYPHIPYVNVFECINEKYGYMDCDVMPNSFNLRMDIESDGIHIRNRKAEYRFVPSESIKTIARVDEFTFKSKGNIGHSIFLMASTLTVEEMANRGKLLRNRNWKQSLITDLPYEEELWATEYLKCKLWLECGNYKNEEWIPMFYKPQNEQKLRQMYPHAQWLDISPYWKQ